MRIFSRIAAAVCALAGCSLAVQGQMPATAAPTKVVHPGWSRDAVIYEVNVRQFTPEGTFQAFDRELPRLKDLGVDILWFMPVHPISEKNRKGKLGSYYAVRDYKAINPEFGTLEDFKNTVRRAHDLGMKVIIDWVPNHSGSTMPGSPSIPPGTPAMTRGRCSGRMTGPTSTNSTTPIPRCAAGWSTP